MWNYALFQAWIMRLFGWGYSKKKLKKKHIDINDEVTGKQLSNFSLI